MPRLLFQKLEPAIYASHLDTMRVFQRAFQRAGLPLTHTQGYNPRPSVSIALPLSLGVESRCELLDFELEREVPCEEVKGLLNQNLISGIEVLAVYEEKRKLKELTMLESLLTLEYDRGIPAEAEEKILELLGRDSVTVEKKGKNGIVEQDIVPMIRSVTVRRAGEGELEVGLLACCQNPTLNPMQVTAAIEKYLPELRPDFVRCCRVEIYDENKTVFR